MTARRQKGRGTFSGNGRLYFFHFPVLADDLDDPAGGPQRAHTFGVCRPAAPTAITRLKLRRWSSPPSPVTGGNRGWRRRWPCQMSRSKCWQERDVSGSSRVSGPFEAPTMRGRARPRRVPWLTLIVVVAAGAGRAGPAGPVGAVPTPARRRPRLAVRRTQRRCKRHRRPRRRLLRHATAQAITG
jgi:hypothetical protein